MSEAVKMTVVETYRARARLKVGHAYREPGDLIPEAMEWPRNTILVHERTHNLERVFVSPEEMTAAREKNAQREADALAEMNPVLEEAPEESTGSEDNPEGNTDPVVDPETPNTDPTPVTEESIEGLGDPETEDDDSSETGKKKIVRRSKT